MSRLQNIHISSVTNKTGIIRLAVLGLLLYYSLDIIAQEIVIEAVDKPLNTVIFHLIEEHQVQLSYNDRHLSRHKITINQVFDSPESALSTLLAEQPFEYKLVNGVYVIYKSRSNVIAISGTVMDIHTHERLPYSHVIINGLGQVSDGKGNFYFQSGDSLCQLQASYLGYYVLDTVLRGPGKHGIYLNPSITQLSEVLIEGKEVEYSTEIGDAPGQIRLNHKTAKKLPGNGDNSVFNFLRLKPGVLAAGEQSNDLIIWGGYTGHSKVQFDGFTLFGLKNFNDNIGAINPYMVKDMLILKGGYGAEYGERVGGIVDITGIEGNRNVAAMNLNINNMTISGMASIPVMKQSSLIFAFRRTYYNLYNEEDINIPLLQGKQQQADISTYPDYTFGDFNLKYAGETEKFGSYYLSLYRGSDNFSYTLNQERGNVSIEQDAEEKSRQQGGGLNWNKLMSNGISSSFSVNYSDFNKDLRRLDQVKRTRNQNQVFNRSRFANNSVNEASTSGDLRFPLLSGQFSFGLEYRYNEVHFEEEVNDEVPQLMHDNTGRLSAFITEHFVLWDRVTIEPGLRMAIPLNHDNFYFQPRFALSIDLSSSLKSYASWGIYNQFITQASILDDYGNYQYFWAIADNNEVPVLHSIHQVAGIKYYQSALTFSAEAYYKTTDGLSRYINLLRENIRDVFEGQGRAYGIDLFLKRKISRHDAWISYSISKTEEYFDYFPDLRYRPAPQDQRHEIKTAVLLNFSPFYFSANYVYGSGFISRQALNVSLESARYPYSRLDAAIIYRFGVEKCQFEAGLSILNLLNTENIKYANFIRVPSEQISGINIHAEAVPFTPAIYLNMAF